MSLLKEPGLQYVLVGFVHEVGQIQLTLLSVGAQVSVVSDEVEQL